MSVRKLVLAAAGPVTAGLVVVAGFAAGIPALATACFALAALLAVTTSAWAIVAVGRSAARVTRLANASQDRLEQKLAAGLDRAVRASVRAEMERGAARNADALRLAEERAVAQLEAYIQLVALLQPRALLPQTRGWAASPDILVALSRAIHEHRPSLVLDLGSGVSTVVAGLTVERLGIPCRVVGVDHDPGYAEKTRALLVEHRLVDVAEVRLAPLVPVEIDGQTLSWYDPSAFEDLDGIGVVFVDGPPGTGGPQARYPALPLLRSRLAPDAVLLLDDTSREDERAIVERWEAALGVRAVSLSAEKGGSMLCLRSAPSEPAVGRFAETG